jgi:hypothetical protein
MRKQPKLGDLSRGPRSRENLSIQLATGTRVAEVVSVLRTLRAHGQPPYTWPNADRTPLPKFSECLPPEFAASTVAARATDLTSWELCLSEPVGVATRR